MTTTIDGVRTYRIANPATGELIREIPGTTEAEAFALLERAHAAFAVWRDVPLDERIAVLHRIADLLDADAESLGRQVSTEMGKVYEQSVTEAHTCAAIFRMYADNGEQWLGEEDVDAGRFTRLWVRREAVGVTLGVEPWNVPLYQAVRVAAPNLLLGNAVLLKPSNITAGSTLMLDDLFARAGLPEGVYATALLSSSQVSSLIADPRVRAVTLTGSDRVGQLIGEQAGRRVKPVVLELGGSDPFVVLDDADVERAAETLVARRLQISGQVCASPKRIIVTDKVADRLTDLVAEGFRRQVVGDPFDPSTTVGPLSSESAADDLQALYDDAVSKGAVVVVPGGRVAGPGAFFAPAVLTGITRDMRLYYEEAFGPIALIHRVPDADAAIEMANDTPYGLSGTVFSEDLDEAHRVARHLDSGGVGINDWIGGPIQAPFGGTKVSGVGRELGRAGVDSFANIKTYGITE
ncbi:aldehyde dehydrogenase family protein [Gordonia sp. LSe1-13]|uniref:Aldehyde dehydrogenase family protein n=1 Tax=Gordonia sesuvii TaxID=3116777 RepID=A0ABU7MK85_9ACTN|nr:aldehyde dehydrogenase family protein [Gordonia sp. LSe1-13]